MEVPAHPEIGQQQSAIVHINQLIKCFAHKMSNNNVTNAQFPRWTCPQMSCPVAPIV